MAWDNIACAANGMSPISSKNNVPLNARSNNPGLFLLPVPTNCSGIDATSIREHFTETKALLNLLLSLNMRLAITLFPTPDSPYIVKGAVNGANNLALLMHALYSVP